MVVVMQTFTRRDESKKLKVVSGIWIRLFAIHVTERVHTSVDQQICRSMKERGKKSPLPTKCETEDTDAKTKAKKGMIKEHAVKLVWCEITCVPVDGHTVACNTPVVEGVKELDLPKTEKEWGMGVTFNVSKRMMFAVDGRPLTRLDSGSKPDQYTEGDLQPRLKCDRLVGGKTVKVDRCRKQRKLKDTKGAKEGEKWLGHICTLSVGPTGT